MESPISRLLAYSRLTAGRNEPDETVIRALCDLADLDGEGQFETSLNFGYPFFQYLAEAAGIDAPAIRRNQVFVTVRKRIIPDLEKARAPFAALFGQGFAEEMFPDWAAEDVHTDIEIRNAPLEFLYSDKHPSYDVHIAVAANGSLLRSRAYVSPPMAMEGEIMNGDLKKVDLPSGLVAQVARILHDQIQQAREPRHRSEVMAEDHR